MHHHISFTLKEILPILPHRPPFLFVDRVLALDPHKSILAERTLRAEEPQFAGHFPGSPIMPGVLVTEALAQTSGLLLGLSEQEAGEHATRLPKMFYLAATAIKYTHPARPGDVLRLWSASDQSLSGVHRFRVQAKVGRRLIATGALTLALVNEAVAGTAAHRAVPAQ
jgi:3-hydroxyacyl-[acyl-carrier-protein] dehydratase